MDPFNNDPYSTEPVGYNPQPINTDYNKKDENPTVPLLLPEENSNYLNQSPTVPWTNSNPNQSQINNYTLPQPNLYQNQPHFTSTARKPPVRKIDSPSQFSRPIVPSSVADSQYFKTTKEGNKVLNTHDGYFMIIFLVVMIFCAIVIPLILSAVFICEKRYSFYYYLGPGIIFLTGILFFFLFGGFAGNTKTTFNHKEKVMTVKRNSMFTCFCLARKKCIPYNTISYFDMSSTGLKVNSSRTYICKAYLNNGSSVKVTSYCFLSKATSILSCLKIVLANGLNSQ